MPESAGSGQHCPRFGCVGKGHQSAIIAWFELTYHRQRGQDRLWRVTPMQFELIIDQECRSDSLTTSP